MAFGVLCTFDITGGTSSDYKTMYEELEKLGLSRFVKTSDGSRIELPTTTVFGEASGQSSAAVRDMYASAVDAIYKRHQLHGKRFVLVGNDWAWGFGSP